MTSLGCNFDCPYCFENKPAAILDDETERLLLEVLDAQLPTIERFHVTWYGGEPLLGQDRIDRLSEAFLERTRQPGWRTRASIVTNGYLLTPDVARRLAALQVRDAQITLDGPAETHDLMRPLRNGRGTFDVDPRQRRRRAPTCCRSRCGSTSTPPTPTRPCGSSTSWSSAASPARSRSIPSGSSPTPTRPAPRARPTGRAASPCRSSPRSSAAFLAAAYERGLAEPALPEPVGTPCTAVRVNELVVGARGELYKCFDSVGDAREVVGHLRSWQDPNDRVLKWLRYDPFADAGCRSCIALPSCMGGCAHHEMTEPGDSKCSTFRLTHRRQVEEYAAAAEAGTLRQRPRTASCRSWRSAEACAKGRHDVKPLERAWYDGLASSYTRKEVVQS